MNICRRCSQMAPCDERLHKSKTPHMASSNEHLHNEYLHQMAPHEYLLRIDTYNPQCLKKTFMLYYSQMVSRVNVYNLLRWRCFILPLFEHAVLCPFHPLILILLSVNIKGEKYLHTIHSLL